MSGAAALGTSRSLAFDFRRAPLWGVPAALAAIGGLVAAISALVPAFYARVVWQYYWGPIKADAFRVETLFHDGVAAHAGYNLVNTLTWVALLLLCMAWAVQILRRFSIPAAPAFAFASTAWVVAGAIWHVLQDTFLVRRPWEYLLITPIVYFLVFLIAAGFLVTGAVAARVHRSRGVGPALAVVAAPFALGAILWFLADAFVPRALVEWLPRWVALAAFAAGWLAVATHAHFAGGFRASAVMGFAATTPLVLALAYVGMWVWDAPWVPWHDGAAALPWAAVAAPALAGVVTAGAWGVARAFAGRGSAAAAWFAHPVSLLVVFAHTLDGAITAMGLDLRNYAEKHVFSAWLIERAAAAGATYPAFTGFLPYKIVLGLALVGVLYAAFRDEWARERAYPLMGLTAATAIIIVGIGPGVRNLVRLALGV